MRRFTRQELYELVWSEPLAILAGQFELSDVGMAKACKRAGIPRPPRGYWAKLKAGKKTSSQPLPARGPGMSDEVEIGSGRYHHYRRCSEEEILASNPMAPAFEDAIEDVTKRVKDLVGRVSIPKFPNLAHRRIRRLLDADEERRQKQLSSLYTFSWDSPLFNGAFEKRRLRILNAIMTTLEQKGMKPSLQGRHARNLSVSINDTNVQYTLDATTQKNDPFRDASIESRGASSKLRLQILCWGPSSGVRLSWEDTDNSKLERHLDDIIVELIVSGECQYRETRQRNYEWFIERKANLIEETRKRKEEAARKKHERRVALEQARIDRLTSDAAALQQASNIRSYVSAVREALVDADDSASTENMEVWAAWALSQAARIDPVQSGRFLDSMNDHGSDEDTER